jgi:hypothetical protein
MKLLRIVYLAAASLALLQNASGQGFENLDFESATVVLEYPPSLEPIYASIAIPGWTAYNS